MRLSMTGRAVLALLVIGVALLGASGSMAHGGKGPFEPPRDRGTVESSRPALGRERARGSQAVEARQPVAGARRAQRQRRDIGVRSSRRRPLRRARHRPDRGREHTDRPRVARAQGADHADQPRDRRTGLQRAPAGPVLLPDTALRARTVGRSAMQRADPRVVPLPDAHRGVRRSTTRRARRRPTRSPARRPTRA